MKVIISYPPLNDAKGYPTLGQNRQFQYFRDPTFIYPVVPAQAATLLKQAGHEVIWNDCLAQGWDYGKFIGFIRAQKPDIIAFETKTPVIKQHWKLINDIKSLIPHHAPFTTVLFGDHVTALPEESFENSEVDFILTGGDYDFLLLNLANVLQKSPIRSYSLLSAELEPGIYYREDGKIKNTGKFKLNHDLDLLPFIDRDLTSWQLYAYRNGNFKCTPGTYIMSGRDCWYHLCKFCSWPTLYPEFRTRSANNVLQEIDLLLDRYHIREIMDDTGCFPIGGWLNNFCNGLIKLRLLKRKAYFDCNMRFGALDYSDFVLMKRAGFRLLLFGLESANQGTLDRLNKKVKVERIIQDCKNSTRAGLFPHITMMFGYPWEDYESAQKTLELGTWLLKKGYAYTMQATIVIPYPGTVLFEECKEGNLLKTLDWEDYDMKQPVMQIPIPDDKLKNLVQGMYKVSFSPEFIFRKAFSIRDTDDFVYALRAGRKVLGHIFDFGKKHETTLPG